MNKLSGSMHMIGLNNGAEELFSSLLPDSLHCILNKMYITNRVREIKQRKSNATPQIAATRTHTNFYDGAR